MSLRQALSTRGVDIDRIRLIPETSSEAAMDRFRTGETGYIHLPHPQAQELIDEGRGI